MENKQEERVKRSSVVSEKKVRSRSKSSNKSSKKRKKHRKHSSSSSDSSSSDSERERKLRKEKKRLKKLKKAKLKSELKEKPKSDNECCSTDIPLQLMDNAKATAPMTKEQWEKQQSVIKRVYDESTGRHRLIKGDGEVIEEIVSRDRHLNINKQATKGDGDYFQSKMYRKK